MSKENTPELKIKVNSNLCIGCGLCASICPDCFELSEDDYKSHVKSDCQAKECAQKAIDSCPVGAIGWEE